MEGQTYQSRQLSLGVFNNKIKKISCHDPLFPQKLLQIYDPPSFLFVQGKLIIDEICLAIVGPRKPSEYAKRIAQKISTELSNKGLTIVSGLAKGIDSIVHEAVLSAKGRTIAILGSGIDQDSIYPREHCCLAKRITKQGGAVMSEYPPGSKPTKYSFPKRNRIMAGMSAATLVIEAGEKSGTLITAQYALDSGREVMIIPQNIDSITGIGSNKLLKSGAHPVTCSEEIVEILKKAF